MFKEKNKLTLQDYQKISLDILVDVAKFCEENSITYFLICGTLLGAVRHKGFIPWDDDIDIAIPRKEYIKFLEIYKSDKYKLLRPNNGMFFYTKVYDTKTVVYEKMFDYKKIQPIGVSIDIFPLDGMINDKKIANRIIKKSAFYETLLRMSNQPINYRKKLINKLYRIATRIIGSKNLIRIIEEIDQKYDYNESDYVIRIKTTPNGINKPLPKSIYEIEKKEFEGFMFNVPKGYDLWLKSFFGDNYMELPPEEKRTPHLREGYFI